MAWNLDIPEDVIEYVVSVFRECNEQVSRRITIQPNTYEATLDQSLIDQLGGRSRPQLCPSNWVVTIETHFLGGGRHYGRWEIADIGVLVNFRMGGQVRRSKVGLLQCKRLYANELALEEDDYKNYRIGFGRLFGENELGESIFEPRQYSFLPGSRYKSITVDSKQKKNIEDYENASSIPIFYLLYNPWQIPWTAVLPVSGEDRVPTSCEVGCRVVPSDVIDRALGESARSASPSYQDVCNTVPSSFDSESRGGWRLERFIKELITCRQGYYSEEGLDARFQNLFGARTAAIAAAFSVTIDAPG